MAINLDASGLGNARRLRADISSNHDTGIYRPPKDEDAMTPSANDETAFRPLPWAIVAFGFLALAISSSARATLSLLMPV